MAEPAPDLKPTPFRQIRLHGNRVNPFPEGVKGPPRTMFTGSNLIVCRDGYMFSVIAGWGAYCTPRPDMAKVYGLKEFGITENYEGPYTCVEVGFRNRRLPKPWNKWKPYCDGIADRGNTYGVTVFAYVPIDLVYDLIKLHRGQADYVPSGAGLWPNNARNEMHRARNLARMRCFGRRIDGYMEREAT